MNTSSITSFFFSLPSAVIFSSLSENPKSNALDSRESNVTNEFYWLSLLLTTRVRRVLYYSLRMYNNLVEKCFSECVNSFRRKSLEKDEERCVSKCCEKFLKHSARVSVRFAELNAQTMEQPPPAAWWYKVEDNISRLYVVVIIINCSSSVFTKRIHHLFSTTVAKTSK